LLVLLSFVFHCRQKEIVPSGDHLQALVTRGLDLKSEDWCSSTFTFSCRVQFLRLYFVACPTLDPIMTLASKSVHLWIISLSCDQPWLVARVGAAINRGSSKHTLVCPSFDLVISIFRMGPGQRSCPFLVSLGPVSVLDGSEEGQ
jgi:hypothetical protein